MHNSNEGQTAAMTMGILLKEWEKYSSPILRSILPEIVKDELIRYWANIRQAVFTSTGVALLDTPSTSQRQVPLAVLAQYNSFMKWWESTNTQQSTATDESAAA